MQFAKTDLLGQVTDKKCLDCMVQQALVPINLRHGSWGLGVSITVTVQPAGTRFDTDRHFQKQKHQSSWEQRNRNCIANPKQTHCKRKENNLNAPQTHLKRTADALQTQRKHTAAATAELMPSKLYPSSGSSTGPSSANVSPKSVKFNKCKSKMDNVRQMKVQHESSSTNAN